MLSEMGRGQATQYAENLPESFSANFREIKKIVGVGSTQGGEGNSILCMTKK